MDELFRKEFSLDRISRVTNKPQCIHPIGRVPKKDSGKSRQITDCSRPHGSSLNDYIKRDLESFRMNSIDTAVSFACSNCFYAITDIESAWRFFASLIWSLKPPKTMTPRKRCPVRTLSFALGVWSSVFVGQRPSNSGSVNYLYLLFAFRWVIHFAQFKPTSAMFVSSLRLPSRLPFCSHAKSTSPQ